MAEIWGAAIAVGGSIIAGKAAEKKAKQDKKDEKEMTRDSTRYEAILSQFEAEQQDYYSQLNRQRKQRGLDQFRQFATLSSGNTEPSRIVVPDKPNINTILDEVAPEPQSGVGKKGKSTWEKIDPLGSKLLGGLF